MEIVHKNRENVAEKRFHILSESRLHDLSQVTKAALTQDRIRRKVGQWKGAKEIQQWRSP